MENASQALIIAGAILLAILLIAIGMFIFNKANDSIQKSANSISSEDANAFNAKFEPYVGTRVSGTQIKALLGQAAITAQTQETSGITGTSRLKVLFKKGNELINSQEINLLKNGIKDLEVYSVTLDYEGPVVNKITILQVNN